MLFVKIIASLVYELELEITLPMLTKSFVPSKLRCVALVCPKDRIVHQNNVHKK